MRNAPNGPDDLGNVSGVSCKYASIEIQAYAIRRVQ